MVKNRFREEFEGSVEWRKVREYGEKSILRGVWGSGEWRMVRGEREFEYLDCSW